MDDVRKSQTSLRQSIRNPSGRVIIALAVGVIAILLAIFLPGEISNVKENFDKRPKVIVVTPSPLPHRWTEGRALDFFREYATIRPAPAGRLLSTGIETCWDFAMSESSGALVPFRMGSGVNSIVAPLAPNTPLWGLISGDAIWRFWENTRSVVGPC